MKNYKVSHQRPEISRQEAGKMADFNRQLEAVQNTSTGSGNTWKIVRSVIVFAALVGLVFIIINRKAEEVVSPVSEPFAEKPEIIEARPDVTEESIFEQNQPEIQGATTSKPEVKSLIPESNSPKKEENVNSILGSENEEPAGFVEAAPVDGFPALYQYFDEHLEYPSDILDERIEGSVIVKFMINTNGLPGGIIIEKSLHEKLDSTAITLIRNMPLWNPATLEGKPIPSTHRIPLFFQINQTEH